MRRTLRGFVLWLAVAMPFGAMAEEDPATTGTVTGLPIPRFVSLKPNDTPMREGPSKDHRIKWIFKRDGLPVEITGEFDNWRRVRDAEGAEGWIFHARLSGRRTVMVQSRGGELEPLLASPALGSAAVALVEPGVIGSVQSCDGRFCQVTIAEQQGYVRQERLWGVYLGETLED
jgi:SH3-like domain-containing protein